MQQLPNMSRRENSPRRKQERKKSGPAIASSIVAVLIIMFALGNFPQVDAFFAQINETLHQNNDEIVRAMIHFSPAAAFVIGTAGLSYMIASSIRARRRSV